MIRSCDFDVFFRLQRVRDLYMKGDIADIGKLKEIVESNNKNDSITRS